MSGAVVRDLEAEIKHLDRMRDNAHSDCRHMGTTPSGGLRGLAADFRMVGRSAPASYRRVRDFYVKKGIYTPEVWNCLAMRLASLAPCYEHLRAQREGGKR